MIEKIDKINRNKIDKIDKIDRYIFRKIDLIGLMA